MIKIICGHFGHNNGTNVELKTKHSEPFSADKDVETRLVKAGIAEYVDIEGGDGSSSNGGSKSEYNEDMKLVELKEIAASKYKVSDKDLAKCKSKVSVIELIEAAKANEDEGGEEDENVDIEGGDDAPPSIDASEAVQ